MGKPHVAFSSTGCCFLAKPFCSKLLGEVSYHDIWSYFPWDKHKTKCLAVNINLPSFPPSSVLLSLFITAFSSIIYRKMNGNFYQSGTICYPYYCEGSLVLGASLRFFNTSINKNGPEKTTSVFSLFSCFLYTKKHWNKPMVRNKISLCGYFSLPGLAEAC